MTNWKREGRVDIHRTIEILRRIHFLDRKEEKNWHKLYQHLSRFIHTPDEFVSYVRHHGELKPVGEIVCPASTYFNEEELSRWSNYFQQVFAILIKIIAKYYPEAFETESGKLAINRCILPELKAYGKKISVTGEISKLLPQTYTKNP